jgi:hypothetical protein
MKRFRLLIAVAAIGLGGSVLSLAPAMAATASVRPAAVAAGHAHASTYDHASALTRAGTGTQVARPRSAASPDSCFADGDFFLWNSSCTSYDWWSCAPYNAGNTTFTPTFASNDCAYRVWIYQSTDRGGYNLCISPGTYTGSLKRSYSYAWVSDNTSPC